MIRMELLEYRRVTGATWAELAHKTGVPRTNLNAIAYGKRDCSAETQRMIEDGLNGAVTPNDIQRVRRRFLEKSDLTPSPETNGVTA